MKHPSGLQCHYPDRQLRQRLRMVMLTLVLAILCACNGGRFPAAPSSHDTLRALADSTMACKERGDYAMGVVYADTAMSFVGVGDSAVLAEVLCNRGYMLCKLGRMAEAADDEQQAATVAQAVGDGLQLSRAYLYLAYVNLTLPQYAEARLFVEKALQVDETLEPNSQRHNTYGMACEVFYSQRDSATQHFTHLDEAERYGQLAVDEARRLGDSTAVANHLSQLSYSIDLRGFENPEKGEPYFLRALALVDYAIALLDTEPCQDPNTLALALEYRTFYLMDLNRYDEAIAVLRRAMQMQEQLGARRSLANDYRTLATLLQKTGHPEAADSATQRHNELFDALRTDEMSRKIASADARQHVVLLREQVQHHRQRSLWLIACIIVVVLIAPLTYRVHRKRLQRDAAHIRRLVEELDTLRSSQPAEQDGSAPSVLASNRDEQFLRNTYDAVHRLMPQGLCDVSHVASELCITPSKLLREVKRITGHTAVRYIMAIRMDEAKRLLALRPQPTLADIAHRCGFSDHPHFTNVFRRLYGIPPSQYVPEQESDM